MVTKYEALDDNNDLGLTILELKEGPYAGTKFSFGKVKFSEPGEDEEVVVSFDYDVHDARGLEAPTPEFETIIGDILVGLLEDYAKSVQEKDDVILDDAGIKEPECNE